MILLFGMPRSGTTWVAKLLDSHPGTTYYHEPDSRMPMTDIPLFIKSNDVVRYRKQLDDYLTQYLTTKLVSVRGKTPFFRKNYRTLPLERFYRLGIWGGKLLSRWKRNVGVPLLGSQGIPVWKSIESLGRLGALLEHLSTARGILLLRHPCGHVASVLRGERQARFGAEDSVAEDRGIFEILVNTPGGHRLGLTLEDIMTLGPVERVTLRWLLYNEYALEDVEGRADCRVVRYEDLCQDTENVLQALFDFTGLDWNAQTESFVRQSTAQERTDYYSVFKSPIKAAWKWSQELPEDTQSDIMSLVANSKSGNYYKDLENPLEEQKS